MNRSVRLFSSWVPRAGLYWAVFVKRCLLLACLPLLVPAVQGQSLSVTNVAGSTSTDALNLANIIKGTGISSFSNITLTAHVAAGASKGSDSSSAGSFTGGQGILGIGGGIILSSGGVQNTLGPNTSDQITHDNGAAGDADLAGLISATVTDLHDATILEFDFVPAYGTIAFRYVFASEEYPEYANSQYNDVFGFFVNGHGVANNCALIPGTSTPVSINNVNGGNPIGTNPQHAQYYVNNVNAVLNTEMDGLTTVFSAQASVTPGVVNHIKIAIADVGDGLYDSNVFIQQSSFVSGNAPVAVNDSYIVSVSTPVVVLAAQGVLKNDSDLDNNLQSAQIIVSPSHGTLTLNADGSFTYTPTTGYTGSDSFTYQAVDTTFIQSNVGVVSLTIGAGPLVPTLSTPTSAGITATAATLGGNVTSDGGATVLERGVVYALTATNGNPQIGGTGVTKVTAAGTTGVFTAGVSGLTAGTAYSFTAYATNTVGTSYTSVGTFTTGTAAAVSSLNLASATPTNAATVNWTLIFDSAVSGVTAANFSLSGTATSGASIGTPTTSNGGMTWSIPVTTGGSGTLGLYLANATGLSPGISTTLPSLGQVATVDKTTSTPTLTAPATNGAGSGSVSVDYTLPEKALDGTVTLTFAGSTTVALTLTPADGTSGAHSFSFNPGSILSSADIASATALSLPDGSYTVTLAYQDALGNPAAASASSTSFTLDSFTQTPTLSTPATNGVSSSPFTVSFSLPETALNGSVTLTFTGGSTIALTLASSQQAAGAHSFSVDAANLLSSSSIASSTSGSIPNGTYTVALSYQDALGNSAASSLATNFTLATAPTVTTPTSDSITAGTATLGGNVTSDGGAPITERGVVYSITTANNNPQIGGSGVTKVTASGTTGVFIANITSFTAETGYSFAAYATNSIGTTYTTPVSTFTTLSSNTYLSNLVLSAGTLSPVFASATTSYTATVLKTSAAITVTPTAAESHATLQVRVNGGSYASVTSGSASGSLSLNLGANTIYVLVTAQDGLSVRPYTLTVTRWTNLQNWRNQYFSTIANSGNAADTMTPQNDGLSNLMKFAMGLDPSKNVLVADGIAKSGNDLQFTYQRNIEAIGEVTFIVEWSDTLQSNDWHSAGVTESILSATSTLQQVQATVDATGQPRRFMRLRVTDP